jgi:hypothetical protein
MRVLVFGSVFLAFHACVVGRDTMLKLTCLLVLVILPWIMACNAVELSPSTPSSTATGTPLANPAMTPPPEVDGVLSVQLDQPFTISIDQPAQLTEEELNLTFQEVLEDSRCPSNVECAEAGQARISINVTQMGQTPDTLEMNTNPPLKLDIVTYQDFRIRLLTLNPYPEDIDHHIPMEAYEATFVVTDSP